MVIILLIQTALAGGAHLITDVIELCIANAIPGARKKPVISDHFRHMAFHYLCNAQ